MKIKSLLLAVLTLPLLFVACEENAPVDEVKDPVVAVTAGEVTTNAITFTITSTEADNVAWLVVEATEVTPTASEVLANGTAVEANKSVECVANELKDNTTYTVVAAAKNSKTVVKKEIQMTTTALDPTAPEFYRVSEAVVEFTAEGGNGTIEYEIVNPVEGTEVEATTDAEEWITDVTVVAEENKITFSVAANAGEERTGKIIATYGDLNFEVWVEQAKIVEEPDTVEFTASHINIGYYGLQGSAYNYYVQLSDVGLTEGGYFLQNGNYYLLDFYSNTAASSQGGVIPNGTYTIDDSSAAGTVGVGTYGANVVVVDGVPTYKLYAEGNVVVSDGKIEANIVMENGEIHHVVFEGDLSFGNGNTPSDEFEATHTATSWTWGGSSSYGNKYAVSGEGFSLDVHFPAEFATETALAEGDYIWTSTSWWGYNDFDNEFTTRSFTVEGATVAVDAGEALVSIEGNEYHIELTLEGRDGFTYMIEYNGSLGNNSQGGGGSESDAIVFTSCELPTYNSAYYFYEFKLSNENGDTLSLCVNDYQANSSLIYSDDTYEWISISYCGNLGYFSTRNIVIGGTSYTANNGSMVVVTDTDTKKMDITITLLMAEGGTKTFTFSGIAGESSGNEGGDDNTGNEGGDDNTGNEGGEPTESFENWVFSASLDMDAAVITVTDDTHTVTFQLNQVAGGTYYIYDNGTLNITDVKVNGETAESASGTVEMSSASNYHITLNAVINGVKYTGTSTNAVV